MSDTPRTDKWKTDNRCSNWPEVGISPFNLARQLDRELQEQSAATKAELDELRAEKARLEDELKNIKAASTAMKALVAPRIVILEGIKEVVR